MDSTSGKQREPNGTTRIEAGVRVSVAVNPGAQLSSNREIAVVQADYLALANDLEQAQALASALELQLSGKANELARFKVIWERAQADLVKFAHDLDTMRQERHKLANELQGAYAYQMKYERLESAQNELTARAERLEAELARERAAHAQRRTELEELRAKSCSRAERMPPGNARDPELQRALEALRTQLDRVLGKPAGATAGATAAHPPKPEPPVHIDIEFCA